MIWLRKGFVHLFAIALFASLLGVAAVVNFNRNLAKPEQVKQLIAESGAYDQAVSAALEKSQEDAAKEENDSTVLLTHTIVQQAAKRSFTPDLLEQRAGEFVDANYEWLSGKTDKPEFGLDFAEAKQNFAKLVGEYTVNRLEELPACTAEQLAQLQLPVDPMEVICLPAGLDPATEGDRIAAEIMSSNFLSKPVVTADSLGRDENSTSKPYYERLSQAPKFYQLSQKLPLILGVIALVLILAILFVAPTRRKGWRRIGLVFFSAGLVLVILNFTGNTVVNALDKRLNDSVSTQLGEPRQALLNQLQSNLNQLNLIFGLAFIVLALVIFIKLFLSGREGGGAAPVKASRPSPQPVAEDKPAPRPVAARPTQPSRPAGGMDIMGPAPRPTKPQAKPTSAPPLRRPVTPGSTPQLKKPAKKRPPRLIQ